MSRNQGGSSRQALRGLTARKTTVLTARRKTHKRQCKHCKEPFQGVLSAKYCSTSCRQKAYRKRKRNQQQKLVPVAIPHQCDHCGEAFWSNNVRGQQRYCSASCRQLAYRERRSAAVAALVEAFQVPETEALDALETAGMRDVARLLTAHGLAFDNGRGRWHLSSDRQRDRVPSHL
jgi:hypothetical protein